MRASRTVCPKCAASQAVTIMFKGATSEVSMVLVSTDRLNFADPFVTSQVVSFDRVDTAKGHRTPTGQAFSSSFVVPTVRCWSPGVLPRGLLLQST